MRPAAAEGSTTDGTRQLILRAPGSHRSRVSSAVRVRWSAQNNPLALGWCATQEVRRTSSRGFVKMLTTSIEFGATAEGAPVLAAMAF